MRSEQVQNKEKVIFTTTKPDESTHDCVIAVRKEYAVTYQNGDHSHFEERQRVTLYSLLDSTLAIEVEVFLIRKMQDVVIFKTIGDTCFEFFIDYDRNRYLPSPCHLLGVNKETRTPEWKEGTLFIPKPQDRGQSCVTFEGEPGSALMDDNGMLYGFISVKRRNEITLTSYYNMCLPPEDDEYVWEST